MTADDRSGGQRSGAPGATSAANASEAPGRPSNADAASASVAPPGADGGQATASTGAVDAGARVGGDRWWDPDRARHLEDRPRFCPGCGSSVESDDTSLNVEYWEGDRRVHRVLCGNCDWTADVVRIHRVVAHEPDD